MEFPTISSHCIDLMLDEFELAARPFFEAGNVQVAAALCCGKPAVGPALLLAGNPPPCVVCQRPFDTCHVLTRQAFIPATRKGLGEGILRLAQFREKERLQEVEFYERMKRDHGEG